MKEIAELGSPISPKLSKCSPGFRKKILNIVRKCDMISQDNAEDEEVNDFDEMPRKKTWEEKTCILKKPNHHFRSISLQSAFIHFEETTKSNQINDFQGLNEPEEQEKIPEKVMGTIPDNFQHINELEINKFENIEEKTRSDQDSSQISEGNSEKNDLKVKPRMSLKEELMEFDISQFNFVDVEPQEQD